MKTIKRVVAVLVIVCLGMQNMPQQVVEAVEKKPGLNCASTVKVGKSITVRLKNNGNKIIKVTWKCANKTVLKITKSSKSQIGRAHV